MYEAQAKQPPTSTRIHGYMAQVQELESAIVRCKQKVMVFTEHMIGPRPSSSSTVSQLKGAEHSLDACLMSLSQTIRELDAEIDTMSGSH